MRIQHAYALRGNLHDVYVCDGRDGPTLFGPGPEHNANPAGAQSMCDISARKNPQE